MNNPNTTKQAAYSICQRLQLFWRVYIKGVYAPNGKAAEYNMEQHRFETDPDRGGKKWYKYTIDGEWVEIQTEVPKTLRDSLKEFKKDVGQMHAGIMNVLERSKYDEIPPDGQPAATRELEYEKWGFPVHISRVFINGKWTKFVDYQGHWGIKRREVFVWDLNTEDWIPK